MRALSKGWMVCLIPALAIAGCAAPTAPEPLPGETAGTAALVAPAIQGDEEPAVHSTTEHGC